MKAQLFLLSGDCTVIKIYLWILHLFPANRSPYILHTGPLTIVAHLILAVRRCHLAVARSTYRRGKCFESGLGRPEKESKEKGGGKGAAEGIEKLTNHWCF